jgi:hypothetical protein
VLGGVVVLRTASGVVSDCAGNGTSGLSGRS